MNTADSFAFNALLKLSTTFRLGWADFADAAKGAASLGEAFERISAAMFAWDAAIIGPAGNHYRHGAGIRPSLTHISWSEGVQWGVRDDGAIEAAVNRAHGPVISIVLDGDGEVSFHFHPKSGREPRHIEAGLYLAEALGIKGEYIEAVPPREFPEWRAQYKPHYKLPGEHMDNATLTELERAITDAVESTLADPDSARDDVLDLELKIAEAIEDGDFKEAAAIAREAARIDEAFADAYGMLKCIADGADRVAEEALENMRWRG